MVDAGLQKDKPALLPHMNPLAQSQGTGCPAEPKHGSQIAGDTCNRNFEDRVGVTHTGTEIFPPNVMLRAMAPQPWGEMNKNGILLSNYCSLRQKISSEIHPIPPYQRMEPRPVWPVGNSNSEILSRDKNPLGG